MKTYRMLSLALGLIAGASVIIAQTIPTPVVPVTSVVVAPVTPVVVAPVPTTTSVTPVPATRIQASISLNAASPGAATLVATDTTYGQYLGMPVLVFDVKATGDTLHLRTVTVNMAVSGVGSVGAAYLFQGSAQIASASVTAGVATFANITNGTAGATIPVNTTLPYMIKVDVTGVSSYIIVTASTGTTQTILSSIDATVSVSGSAQGNSLTVINKGPMVTSVGTPTITMTNITPGPATVPTVAYMATFNVNVQAVGTDVFIGLPAASFPAISLTSFTIVKNGAPDIDRKGVGNIVVSYSQPNGTVLDSNIPGTFVIGRNNSVTIPVTVAFTVTLPGGGSYAVKLDKFNWSNSSGRSSVDLKGGEWSTAVISTPFTPPAPVPTPAVPPAIRALKSKALWAAELALTSSRIEFQCYSERQVGTVPAVSVNLNGPATQAAISEATAALIMQISLTSMEVDVRFHSFINGPDGRIIMYGNDTKRPVATKGGYELPMFNVETNINGDQLVPYKDAQSAKITSLDYNGGSLGVRWLEVNSQGFMFSPEAAGNVILEITRNDGTVITFDLRKGIVLTAETLAITAKVGKADTESVIDKIELNIIPITRNGIGFNRLGEIRVTGGPLTVKVAAITEEMGKATSITYRQISPVLGEWVTVPASNGIGTLPNLSKGDWQVIGVFPESVLKEPLYYIYDGKG